MKLFLSTLILFVLSSPLLAQAFWNLDFEYGVNGGQPRKWSIEGEGTYTAKLDSNLSHHGQKSLKLTIDKAQAFVFLRAPRKLVAGKSIQLAVDLRSGNEKSIQCILAFQDPSGGSPITTGPQDLTEEWKSYQHETSIGADYSSDFLLIAVIAVGTGTVWIDNVSIRCNGEAVGNGAPDFREPNAREVDALNKKVVPLGDVKAFGSLKNFDNVRVIGLGENSHGSATIYRTKLQLLKFLVQEKGFNIFALECPTVEADVINNYVLGESVSENELLKNLVYPSWQTREMLDLIEWMRQFNLTSTRKVQFRGIDMQDGQAAIAAMESLAKKNEATLSPILTLKQLWSDGVSGAKDWQRVHADAVMVKMVFESTDESLRSKFDRYHRTLIQSMALKAKTDKTRDDYLAENVMLLATKGNKVIVSGDNTHVTKASGKMGEKLNDTFGPGYLSIGMTFGSGTYWAYGKEKYYRVHPPYAGTYEYFFNKATSKNFILDIRELGGVELFNNTAGFRTIGSMPEESVQFAEINLREHFDLIVYLETSEHTVPLTN